VNTFCPARGVATNSRHKIHRVQAMGPLLHLL
jgi:hypothetical protein